MEEYERAKRRREEDEEEERKREEEEKKREEEEAKRLAEEESKRNEEANVMKEAQVEEFVGEQKNEAEGNLSTIAQNVELGDDGVEEKDWSRLMEVEQELVDLREKH